MSNTSNKPLDYTLAKLAHLDLSGHLQYANDLADGGGYGDVFIGTVSIASKGLLENSQEGAEIKVAVKRLRIHIRKEQGFENILAKELYIWSGLKHANVLPLQGFALENDYPLLISEWMEKGTLRRYLQDNPFCAIDNIILGIAKGLTYLHERGVLHADLKADNVLINQFNEPLICDFGISKMLSATQSFAINTSGGGRGLLRWMAPELFEDSDGGHHTKESDVWAFGMTVYEILTKQYPYTELENDRAIMGAIMGGQLPLCPRELETQNPYLWNICKKCWLIPKDRITMQHVVNNLSGVDVSLAQTGFCNSQIAVHDLLKEGTSGPKAHLDLASPSCEYLIAFDNSPRLRKMTNDELDLPATEPGTTVIKLLFPALELFDDSWKIEVKRRDGGIVTIANVLHRVYEQLRKQLTDNKWTSLSDSEAQKVGQQYQRRCEETKSRSRNDPYSYKYEKTATRRGLRVDLLGNKHWFAGLRQSMSNDPFEFELLVKEV